LFSTVHQTDQKTKLLLSICKEKAKKRRNGLATYCVAVQKVKSTYCDWFPPGQHMGRCRVLVNDASFPLLKFPLSLPVQPGPLIFTFTASVPAIPK
jgi:hypothetical protein